MKKTELRRELAAGALAGSAERVLEARLSRVLVNYQGIRRQLWDGGLAAALATRRIHYVRVSIGRQKQLRIWLGDYKPTVIRNGRPLRLLVELNWGREDRRSHERPDTAARSLARFIGADVERASLVFAGIERARKTLFRLAEEGTRVE